VQDTTPPTPAELPLDDLPPGAELTVRSMRDWLLCGAEGRCVLAALRPRYAGVGCASGMLLLDELMHLLRFSARRPIGFETVDSSRVSADEERMLTVLRSLDGGSPRAGSEALNELMRGTLSRCFCRIGGLYVGELRAAGLPVAGRQKLTTPDRGPKPPVH